RDRLMEAPRVRLELRSSETLPLMNRRRQIVSLQVRIERSEVALDDCFEGSRLLCMREHHAHRLRLLLAPRLLHRDAHVRADRTHLAAASEYYRVPARRR